VSLAQAMAHSESEPEPKSNGHFEFRPRKWTRGPSGLECTSTWISYGEIISSVSDGEIIRHEILPITIATWEALKRRKRIRIPGTDFQLNVVFVRRV
jgi:hypothetical protein